VTGALRKLLGKCPCGGGTLGWTWCQKRWGTTLESLDLSAVVCLGDTQMYPIEIMCTHLCFLHSWMFLLGIKLYADICFLSWNVFSGYFW
jgi:hypothetical protein